MLTAEKACDIKIKRVLRGMYYPYILTAHTGIVKNIFILIHIENSENDYNKIEVYEPTFHQCLFQEDLEFTGTCLISLGNDNYLLLGYGSCALLYINDEFKWILGADYEQELFGKLLEEGIVGCYSECDIYTLTRCN